MIVPFVHLEKFRKILYLLAIFVAFFCASFSVVEAAQVEITPSSGSYSSGQTFTVTVQANPQGASINAVEAQLTFDNSKLSVTSVAKTGSAFSLWTTEPTFSNAQGTIDFGGGSPSPFSSRSTLITITFRATTEGSAAISVASASALAADGLGTDVYTGSVDGTYTVTAATTPTETQTPADTAPAGTDSGSDAAITFGDPPRTPEVGSAVFLDPEVWYGTKAGLFTWDLPFDIDSLKLDLATSSDAEPATVYDPPIEEFATSKDNLIDGVQYLTIQYHNQVGWGATLHRKVKIDTIPPKSFVINVRAGNSASDFPLLTFAAEDETSGISKYEMTIAGGEPIEITPDEAKLGYLLKNLEDGTYTVKVKAHDFAGNITESSVPVLITAGWTPPVEVVVQTTFWDLFKGKNLAILLLLLVIISLIGYIIYLRRKNDEKEQKLRKESREIQDQMEKIFSALRDEIYDQINAITKRQRLSKREKEAVENLNQALEVSETLIEKEIGDVNKILK